MLDKVKAKINNRITHAYASLVTTLQNEEGQLQTFATIIGLTFVSVVLIWVAYETLQSFFPGFLTDFLNSIKSKFTIS